MSMTKAEKERMHELEEFKAEHEAAELGFEHLKNELAGANKLIGEQVKQIDELEVALQASQGALQNIVITNQDGDTLDYEISDGCAVIKQAGFVFETTITRNDLRLALAKHITIPHAYSEAQRLDRAIDEILKVWQ